MNVNLKLFVCVLFGSLFSFTSSHSQVLTVTTESSNSEVYFDDQKAGTGKVVKFNRKKGKKITQVRVDRIGFKSEFGAVGPTEDELKVVNKGRVASAKYGLNLVALSSIDIEKDAEDPDVFSGWLFEYNKVGDYKSFLGSSCTNGNTASGVKVELINSMKKGLVASGYVDTSKSFLESSKSNYFLDITVKDFNIVQYFDRKISCDDLAAQVELKYSFVFKDRFNKVKYKFSDIARSGLFVFSEFDWKNLNAEKRTDVLSIVIADAMQNGLLEALNDTSEFDLSKEMEPLAAANMPVLKLQPKTFATDLKSSLSATVTVITDEGFGTGCVISNDGYIVSSYHVVADQEKNTFKVLLNTGDTLKANIVRTSRFADLVLLKVEHKFPFAFKVESTSRFEVSDEVFAIGTPASLELSQTISRGIISAVRSDPNGLTLIQTDVSVNPGNSGGPLIKKPALFIGVVNSKISGRNVQGLGFCTPSSDIQKQLLVDFN